MLRTLLMAIFDHTPDRAASQSRLQRWTEQVQASGLDCLHQFLNALHHWWEGILNYFDGRYTSGFVEEFNNQLKLLKRQCSGLTDSAQIVPPT